MIQDGFRGGYISIPFAFYKQRSGGVSTGFIPHQHKELELIAMINGEGTFYLNSMRYELKSGDVLVIPPYCIHRAELCAHTDYDCVCFDLSILWDDTLRKELEKGTLTVSSFLSSSDPDTPTMNKCVRDAVLAREQRSPGWEMEVIGNLSVLFGYLKKMSFFVRTETVDLERKLGRAVLEYVTEHFFEQITSRTVAEVLYLNNSYFCRVFKKTFSCCFAEYLSRYRIEQAKMLLNTSELSVSDIALKCGFNSFSYFSKTFKLTVGMTPTEYRHSNHQGDIS